MLKTQALTAQAQGIIGTISSYMTLLNNYPKDTTVEDLLSALGIKLNTTFDFLDGVLSVIGVNEDKIKYWFANIITPEWLEVIGENIKYILLYQLKSVFTCSTNPFIPDNLMEKYESSPDSWTVGDGVLVDVDEIDLFGTLDLSPNSKQGFSYYFDNGQIRSGITPPTKEEYDKAIWGLALLESSKAKGASGYTNDGTLAVYKKERDAFIREIETAKKEYKAAKKDLERIEKEKVGKSEDSKREHEEKVKAAKKEVELKKKNLTRTETDLNNYDTEIKELSKHKEEYKKIKEDYESNLGKTENLKGTTYFHYPGQTPDNPVIFEQTDLYKSRDFNSFLWYIIHESSRINLKERRKCIWDDRNKIYKVPRSSQSEDALLNNKNFYIYDAMRLSPNYGLDGDSVIKYNNFLHIDAKANETGYIPTADEEPISNSFLNKYATESEDAYDASMARYNLRKEYFILESVKDGGKQIVRMRLNPQRYYRKYTISLPIPAVNGDSGELRNPSKRQLQKTGQKKQNIINDLGHVVSAVKETINELDVSGRKMTIGFNKTLFEFDYDYISSIKIYDTKVLFASIMRAIANLSVDIGLSLKTSDSKEMIKGVVQNIVTDVMNEEEMLDVGEYFKFSNEQYDALLQNAQKNIEAGIDSDAEDEFMFAISQAGNGTLSTSQQQSAITHAITIATSATTAAQNGIAGENRYLFADGGIFKYVIEMLKTTVGELITSILSPKIAMIYAVNSYIAGDLEGKNFGQDWKMENFIKSMYNLILSVAKMIRDQILNELYAFVYETLQLLIEKIMIKLTMERIMFYIRQLKSLKALLKQAVNLVKNSPILQLVLNATGGASSNQSYLASIDDVNYADIIPTQTEPR